MMNAENVIAGLTRNPVFLLAHDFSKGSIATIAMAVGVICFNDVSGRMVQAWIEIHKDELFADWELAVAGEQPFRIAPLQ